MNEKGRSIETGWLPLRDSYEEAVLNWYEQVENSFRRREQEPRRIARTEPAPVVKTETSQTRQVFD
jgi:hypothetical protein